jgi:tetratricopeptide (TPR) repeat protein
MIAENKTDFVLRKQALQAAISLAKTQGAAPHRLGEAYKTAAFVAFEANDPDRVVDYLSKAELAHARALAANSVHLARVRSELAINLINLENHDTGLALLELAEPVFAANGSDWQLTHALRWRAIALSQLGRSAEASGTALEALDWARYVYGGGSRAVASWRQEFVDIGLIPASG